MKSEVKAAILAVALVLIVSVSLVVYTNLTKSIEPETAPEAPKTQLAAEKIIAPNFTVIDKDGNKLKFKDLRGKPVVLNFWASWCPPCQAEMPDFNKVYGELGDDIAFMMVDMVGARESIEDGKAFIAEQGFAFPVYFDVDQEAAIAYSVESLPMTVFVDKNGYIVTGVRGMINEKSLRYGISLISDIATDANTN